MNDDRAEVDEIILQIADYKNDYADMAAAIYLLCSCLLTFSFSI